MKEIPTKQLDNFVARILASDLYHRTDLDELSASINKSFEYARVKNKIRGNKKAVGNILKAIGKEYTPELTEELKNLSKERTELEQIVNEYENNSRIINEENIKEVAKAFKKCLIESDIPEVKMYLKEHIEKIVVDKEDVTITFNIA